MTDYHLRADGRYLRHSPPWIIVDWLKSIEPETAKRVIAELLNGRKMFAIGRTDHEKEQETYLSVAFDESVKLTLIVNTADMMVSSRHGGMRQEAAPDRCPACGHRSCWCNACSNQHPCSQLCGPGEYVDCPACLNMEGQRERCWTCSRKGRRRV